jgi:hypothetical protein
MRLLDRLIERLVAAEVEFVLVGGLAAMAHGSSQNTQDVDICCRFSEENLMRIQRAVADLHPVHRMAPEFALSLTPEQCARLKNLYVKTDFGVLDCLGEVKAVGSYDDVLLHSVEIDVLGGRIRILDIATLIKAKEAMGRPHDLVAVQHLKAVLSQIEATGKPLKD